MLHAIPAFALGVLWLQTRDSLPAIGPCLLAAAGLAALGAGLRWLAGRRVLALLACLLLGVSWAAWRAELRLADELGADWEGRDIALTGVIAGLPQAFDFGQRFEFAVETVSTAAAVVPHRIQLAWYRGKQAVPDLRPGQRWQLVVRLRRPHGSANPHGFDYEAWLLERGIRATGYVRADPPVKLAELVMRPAWLVERARAAVRAAFLRLLPAERWPRVGILSALAIGDQQAVDRDQWVIFNRTGTTHLMSISGLHVTMIAGLFGGLAGWAWRRIPGAALRLPAQQAAVLVAALAAFGYAALAGFGVPAQRTLYMLLVAAAAISSRRLLSPARILALALLVVLLADPWAVLAPGFWLSFGVVAALLYIAPGGGARPGWRQLLAGWGVVQWAATLASLPVLLLVFQQFSLVSPLANALAVPVISFVVTPLALLAALLPWWPILALAHWVLDVLIQCLGWLASWPVWQAPRPPLPVAVAAGVGVLLCLLPRGVAGRWLGVFLLLPALFWMPWRPPAGQLRVDVLDVGQGQAVVLRTHRHTLVYDTGPRYGATADAGGRVIEPFLRAQGVDRIDLAVVSHGDADHAGGLETLRAIIPVTRLLSSARLPGAEACLAGQRWSWDGVDFAILHPAGGEAGGDDNDRSCVLAAVANGQRLLLTADIERAGEAALIARAPAELAADVLLVPHHGSRTSSSAELLLAVNPVHALISVGHRNRFGHPHPEVVDRYQALGSILWRTDRDGALQVDLGGEAVVVGAWRQLRPRYWHRR